jgi:hypothetical protein
MGIKSSILAGLAHTPRFPKNDIMLSKSNIVEGNTWEKERSITGA